MVLDHLFVLGDTAGPALAHLLHALLMVVQRVGYRLVFGRLVRREVVVWTFGRCLTNVETEPAVVTSSATAGVIYLAADVGEGELAGFDLAVGDRKRRVPFPSIERIERECVGNRRGDVDEARLAIDGGRFSVGVVENERNAKDALPKLRRMACVVVFADEFAVVGREQYQRL